MPGIYSHLFLVVFFCTRYEVRLPSWDSLTNTRTVYLSAYTPKCHKRNLHKDQWCYWVVIFFHTVLSHPLKNKSFHGRRWTNRSLWTVRTFLCHGEALRPAASYPGLRCAAAGAGCALRAADTVGRAAVLWGGLRLLDLLCASCLT